LALAGLGLVFVWLGGAFGARVGPGEVSAVRPNAGESLVAPPLTESGLHMGKTIHLKPAANWWAVTAETVASCRPSLLKRTWRQPRDSRSGWKLFNTPAIYFGMMAQNLPVLSRDEIRFFVDGVTAGTFLDWAARHPKPVIIGEFGVGGNPAGWPAWLAAAGRLASHQPRIKAMSYFSGDGTDDAFTILNCASRPSRRW
jgi:hypothetical protein